MAIVGGLVGSTMAMAYDYYNYNYNPYYYDKTTTWIVV
ncbi:MAG: hypothetical protein K0R41_1671 [Geminicoccaceae bacterium]|nr:hypothetical protein [Geminicoccaceae bacterium]